MKSNTFQELVSFLFRYLYCPDKKLFTIIKVENLAFELQNYLVEQVNKIVKDNGRNTRAMLSILCSDSHSYIHANLSENSDIYQVRQFDVLDDEVIVNALKVLNLNALVIVSLALYLII